MNISVVIPTLNEEDYIQSGTNCVAKITYTMNGGEEYKKHNK